jgi:superfamily II DNA/RNA helicase
MRRRRRRRRRCRRGARGVLQQHPVGALHGAFSLRVRGLNVASLHGGIPPALRRLEWAAITGGEAPVLVAADAAARGLDVLRLDTVVIVDVPLRLVEYLHRAGRAGAPGSIASLARAAT